MQSLKLLSAAVAGFLLAGAASVHGSVILRDTFTQNPGNLGGRPVETPQTAGDLWGVSGTPANVQQVNGGTMTAQSVENTQGTGVNGYGKAIAPFNSSLLTSTYMLSFNLSILAEPNGTSSTFDVYGGFGNGAGNGTTYSDDTGGPMFFTGYINTSSGTSLNLGLGHYSGQSFVTAQHATLTRAGTSANYTAAVAIQVNPSLSSNNVEFFINGVDAGSDTYTGQIGGLWFKLDNAGNATGLGYTLSNLSVTTAVPEPGVLGLFSVAGCGLLARRRRDRVHRSV